MRKFFDEELNKLNDELLQMGQYAEIMVEKAFAAIADNTPTPQDFLQHDEDNVDAKERLIQDHCFRLLLEQQPVASDLRLIAAILKMISDIERIGDQAHDIAELSVHLTEPIEGKTLEILKAMETNTKEMLRAALDAFVAKDVARAKVVIDADDIVDDLFMDARDRLIFLIREEEHDAGMLLDLHMIAKYFERIADHTVNICEWLLYAIEGKHV